MPKLLSNLSCSPCPTGLSVVVLWCLVSAGPGAAADTVVDNATKLRQCLERQVKPGRAGRWGVVVKELPGGRVLFSRNANLGFNPASNIKLITAAAVLDRLGPGYRFATDLFGELRRGVLQGGLYLRGACDPSLSTARLVEMARRLRGMGVRRIRGPLYLDLSAYVGPTDPPGFRRFRSSHPFRAGVGALSLDHNVVHIAVTPPTRAGEPPVVRVTPESEYVRLKSLVCGSSKATRLRVSTHPQGRATWVTVGGQIKLGSKTRTFWRRVYDPALFTGYTFIRLLRAAGIEVDPRVGSRRVPPTATRLLSDRSPVLNAIVRSGTKHSSNVVAEHLLLALGADRFGWPATMDKGRRAVRRYLKRLGVEPQSTFLENGSGLSRRSSIHPVDMVGVLEGIYRDFGLQPELLSALPLAGVDGTLRRRLVRSRARGRVRAKTGTLSGSSCLSGYAAGGDGRVLLFTFLAGRVRKMPVVRWRQSAMAACLVDYLAPDPP